MALLPRSLLSSFLFLLTACAPALLWKAQGIVAADSHFSSLRLSYLISDLGCRLEFFRSEEEVEALLSSISAPFRQIGQQEIVLILYDGGEEPLRELLRPMEGNMRLRLPPAMVKRLVESLAMGHSVELEMAGCKSFIDAKGFLPLWEKKGELLFRGK